MGSKSDNYHVTVPVIELKWSSRILRNLSLRPVLVSKTMKPLLRKADIASQICQKTSSSLKSGERGPSRNVYHNAIVAVP